MSISLEEAKECGWGDRAEAFVAWRNKLDLIIQNRTGMTTDDLPDWDFGGSFEAGESPSSAATEFLADIGFDDGE